MVHYSLLQMPTPTHHCRLSEATGFSSLGLHRWFHRHIFIYKVINGNLPNYLTCLLTWKHSIYNLPRITTEFLRPNAPWCWNLLKSIEAFCFYPT